jgi:hypothetical protein
MGRRIDIELTSERDDQMWTWRAAGAKQPRGVLDAALLYEGARVGDVVRAEADFEIDGINVTAVTPPRAPKAQPERLEVIGPPREHTPVTSSLAPKRERTRDRDRDGDGPRSDRDPTRRHDRGRERERRPRRTGERTGEPTGERRTAPGRGERAPRADRPARARRAGTDHPPRPATEAAPRPRPKRLQPKRVHRDEALASLSPEQRPVAEQVLRGGLPAVRQAVKEQNAKARAAGEPLIKPDALLAMAEDLLPRLKAAEWLDRAEAAVASIDDITLRDLRAIVTGSEGLTRDDVSRTLAAELRDALQRRAEEQRTTWIGEITSSLDEGRVVRALRASSRPPEPGTTVPPELASRLTDAAGAAMAADVPPDRWAAVLDAVVSSPVRKSVQPQSLPAEQDDALLAAARQAAPRVPALGTLLGIARPAVGAAGRQVRRPRPAPASSPAPPAVVAGDGEGAAVPEPG